MTAGYLFVYAEKESDHEGTRTLNLPIRTRMLYPLGHAANHMRACKQLFALSSNFLLNLLKQKVAGLRAWDKQLICPESFGDT